MPEKSRPEKTAPGDIIRAGGREFRLQRVYDESSGEYLLDYPDFEENPEYTDDGRPFTLLVRESCRYVQSVDPNDPDPGNCGGCILFRWERAPNDAIGVCMCEPLRRPDMAREQMSLERPDLSQEDREGN